MKRIKDLIIALKKVTILLVVVFLAAVVVLYCLWLTMQNIIYQQYLVALEAEGYIVVIEYSFPSGLFLQIFAVTFFVGLCFAGPIGLVVFLADVLDKGKQNER